MFTQEQNAIISPRHTEYLFAEKNLIDLRLFQGGSVAL